MIPDRFATRPLRARDQLEAWREWYQPVLDVVCEQPTGHGFSAEIQLWNLGGLGVSRTTSALPVHVARAKSNLRRDPVDHWVISYCPGGGHFARTAGSDVGAPPRVPFLWSLGQEFLHERPRVDRVQFLIPRDAFRDIAPLLDASCGLPLNSPLGCLLGDYMIALLRRLPDLRAADYPGLMSAVRAMGAAAVEPSAERVALADRQIDLGRRERVQRVVGRHLRTANFGPEMLCRLVGMSRSNLYRLLEHDGGVARYIQSQRLLEAHVLLTDFATAQPIAAIAQDLCFADASSFSRAYKREFGRSPGEARSLALASGLVRPSAPRRRGRAEGAGFGDLLRGF